MLACVEDYEARALSLLGKHVGDFVKSGAFQEQTLRDNVEAFKKCVLVFCVCVSLALYCDYKSWINTCQPHESCYYI